MIMKPTDKPPCQNTKTIYFEWLVGISKKNFNACISGNHKCNMSFNYMLSRDAVVYTYCRVPQVIVAIGSAQVNLYFLDAATFTEVARYNIKYSPQLGLWGEVMFQAQCSEDGTTLYLAYSRMIGNPARRYRFLTSYQVIFIHVINNLMQFINNIRLTNNL